MEYVEYFRKFPGAYAKVVGGFDRKTTLTDYLNTSGILDGAESMLSIGPGDGVVEVALMQQRGLRLGFIEPSKLFFDQCLAGVQEAGLEAFLVEARNEAFQDYRSAERYDIVLSLFSWFALGFDRAMLEKALACVKPGGRLLICLQVEPSPSTIISAASRSEGISLTSEKLSDWANAEGFAHDYDVYHGLVPTERYLKNGNLTEAGRDLTSFVSATPWEEIPQELKSTALDAMQAASDGAHIDLAGGCLIFTV